MWSSNSEQQNQAELDIKNPFQVYHTPIKQNSNSQFDFNYYFGNLFSSGHLPVPHFESLPSSSQPKRENNQFILKSNIERSAFKFILGSEYRAGDSATSNKVIEESSSSKLDSTVRNFFTKKNLCEVFNNVRNENICSLNYNYKYNKKNENMKKSHKEFLISSPPQKEKNKKIFECSESTMYKSTSFKSTQKKRRRFRKNDEQLKQLLDFYSENKQWSKNQIKRISEEIGLEENKVYKWLWDQKNKEHKNAKFVINK